MTAPLTAALAAELSRALAAVVGTEATHTETDRAVSGDAWVLSIATDLAARGTWTLLIDGLGAEAVTAAVMGVERPVPAPAVADAWRETLTQALSGPRLSEVASGVAFRVVSVEAEATAKPTDPHASFEIRLEGHPDPVSITVCGAIDVALAAPGSASATESPYVVPTGSAGGAEPGPMPDRLDAILDIELPLVVRFGRTELPLRALTHLGPGALIDLARSADDPVDLLVSNRVVARGEVVVVGGNYGVRVLDVVSPRERARSMEA
jgi:flagellar motor switch protein FliN/FliY